MYLSKCVLIIFFTQRVVRIWNEQLEEMVEAGTKMLPLRSY